MLMALSTWLPGVFLMVVSEDILLGFSVITGRGDGMVVLLPANITLIVIG